MAKATIGIIGGSGLYRMEALQNAEELQLDTPWGRPSDSILTGEVGGVPVAFLARHGRNHALLPGEVPYQANIYAMKQLGVRYLLSFSAVGSLREEIAPLDMVLPDQYIDMTRQRPNSFFGNGVVAHVSLAQPTCSALGDLLAQAVDNLPPAEGVKLHRGGAYLCMEGPQFSTLAESNLYRSFGASVIGMTNMPEARLAREAQIAYTSLAMVTDYDCWHPKEAQVTAELAIRNLMQNASRAQQIARRAIALIAAKMPQSAAHSALNQGLVTPLEQIATERRAQIELLLQ
ncbi:S-methyl-5'-thioadenosine phosphorylase [Marinobacterium zhoushanense]|uniref:S-methyl-5'-thioadenosine phosphorylase n=1 Tax=Marinobacterium zhoushanense TaxID=1679163 RepID=A0ABQ1KKI3_9GAMM|nr:S-methyl-5'-thioadenosine phosphorylase [Marinobacterium zhoushanense]GGC01438.1 S-methyl-5'-thioadenosine phosphorylase [Marinobacterium zhoushanense]